MRSLAEHGQYRLSVHYCGVPSCTASVQGELFYGVKQGVPAFRFWDRNAHKEFRMSEGDAAVVTEQRISRNAESLLKGGSSYSNNFSGGAEKYHYCATSLGKDRIGREINFFNFCSFLVYHQLMFFKIFVLVVWEMLAGSMDCLRWTLEKGGFLKELQFIPIRALICVWLRELITLGACRDIKAGLPSIHLNYLGFDEQAHHRGPDSGFAHRSLRVIDNNIRKIYQAAIRSRFRNYDVWIYSDHGQIRTVSFKFKFAKTIEQAVGEVLLDLNIKTHHIRPKDHYSMRNDYLQLLSRKFARKPEKIPDQSEAVLTADGTLGNIYLPRRLSEEEIKQLALKLSGKAGIPAVASPAGPGQIKVWTFEGELILPLQADRFLGSAHPFLKEVTEDLINLCHHPLSGDLIILGWEKDCDNLTFSADQGDHAGVAPEETSAFALIPSHVFPADKNKPSLKTINIRHAALSVLQRSTVDAAKNIPTQSLLHPVNRTIRIMTYNVHSCRGMDGKVSPERIARVISRHEPDIVALQELDLGRQQTGKLDQARIIARLLQMYYHFHPSMQIEEEAQYGNAVFSRFPMNLKKAGALPALFDKAFLEPRGAMWVDIDVEGTHLQLFNTHLSLIHRESRRQSEALTGPEWLAHPQCRGPVVLCGDFNSLPDSRVCQNIKKSLFDAQEILENHRPRPTWFSHYPLGRIDHVFVNAGTKVVAARVLSSDLNKIASDHLPLIIDFKWPPKFHL